jgi:hypothetical protein
MQGYDHGRAFVWSDRLHWSLPSFSRRHSAWVENIQRAPNLAEALALSGFAAIWLDRFGYGDDGGEAHASLLEQGAVDMFSDSSGRYVALDLRPLTRRLREEMGAESFEQRAAELVAQLLLEWHSGFYAEELGTDGKRLRWSTRTSRLVVWNPMDEPVAGSLSFFLASAKAGVVILETESQEHRLRLPGDFQPARVHLPLSLEAGERQSVWLSGKMGRVDADGDSRDLRFLLSDYQLITSPAVKSRGE